jgi:hypothetical protein
MTKRTNLAYSPTSTFSKIFGSPVYQHRVPGISDRNFKPGQIWIKRPSGEEEAEAYMLVSVEGGGADWHKIGNALVESIIIITDSGSASPEDEELDVLGGPGINTTGSGKTVTIHPDGNVLTSQYDGDTGSAAPSAGILKISGGDGTVSSASGNTVACAMKSPFTGSDFEFDTAGPGAVRIVRVQSTSNTAGAGAVLEARAAGTASAVAMNRLSVLGTSSFANYIDPAMPAKSHYVYKSGDDATPGSYTHQLSRSEIDGSGPRTIFGGRAGVEHSSGNCDLFANAIGVAGTDATLTLEQLSGTDDMKIHYGAAGKNWYTGVRAAEDNSWFLTQKTAGGWPPDNTSTIMKAAPTGAVTFPLTPKFSANTQNAPGQGNVTGNGTVYTVQYKNVGQNVGGGYDGTSTFTAPVGGSYHFFASLRASNMTAAATTLSFAVQKTGGGSVLFEFQEAAIPNAPTDTMTLSGSAIIILTAGDTAFITFTVWGMPGDTVNLDTGAYNNNKFACFLLG